MVKKESAVIYIDKDKMLFYVKEAQNVLELSLPADVISNLEIINTDKLGELVDKFFQSATLKDKEFDAVAVFSSNITFDRELEENTSKFVYEEQQKFLDTVPFENILSNSFRIGKKTKIAAVNKDFYDDFRQVLEKNKVHITLALPMSILSEVNPELKNKIDLALIESKAESYKQYSLIDFSEFNAGDESTTPIGPIGINIKKKDLRLYALLGIFGTLLVILIIMVYSTFFSQPNPARNPHVFQRGPVTPIPASQTSTASGSVNESSSSSKLN